ncbi:guanine nucleotide exchange protein for ADP-robosylation factor, partial [Elasticomyces elasticus]
MAEEDTDSRAERPPSNVFVIHALEAINASKDARKSKELGDATQAALQHIRNTEQKLNPELLFRPLQLASRSRDVPTQVTALDCIGKLISYSYFAFSEPSAESNTPSLIER